MTSIRTNTIRQTGQTIHVQTLVSAYINHKSILDKSSFLGKSKSATGINTQERPSTSLQQKFSLKRQKVIKEYIKRQDITLAREVPYPSLHKLKK